MRLVAAYKALFAGNGGVEDAEMVLADLAQLTGFFLVAGPEVTDQALRYAEGQRSVFKRITGMLAMPQSALTALQEAAYQESITNVEEGEI